MTRTELPIVTTVVVVGILCVGFVGLPATSVAETPSATAVENPAITTGGGDAFETNVSVSSDDFDEAEQNFRNASEDLESASNSLSETNEAISNRSSYTEDDHEGAVSDIEMIDEGLHDLEGAQANATKALAETDLSPAERFLILETMEAERSDTTETVEQTLETYEETVETRRADAQSTVLTYVGGGLVGGLLVGAVLGAIVPLVEARNVQNQMDLTANVSYNRRAGLLPIAAGLGLLVCGLGILWFVGTFDLVRVIV